jgi:hypothetical protein
MKQVDPVLLEFLQQLTSNCAKTTQPTNELNVKNIQRLYILSVLLFNANSICSVPFHVVLTDAILCHGGSLELVNIMNRVGAVASIDTFDRLATEVVEIRLQEGIKTSLKLDMITLVSLDNVDILQPYAIVAATDATRSWHGTSVQCMQPLPLSGALSEDEKVSMVPSELSSPSSPPIQRSKRRCALTEQTHK